MFCSLKRIIFYLFVYFQIVERISCNIWDNLFSNLKSPLVSIPEEFCVELFDKENDKLKLGEIWVSSKNNKMKFVIFDSVGQANVKGLSNIYELNVYLNMIKNRMDNTTNAMENLGINTNNQEISTSPKQLVTMIFNFNKDSSIIFISQDYCQIQKNNNLNHLNVKLILVSYDLFTYFEENSENDMGKEKIYDDYILTNFPVSSINKFNNFLSEKEISKFIPLLEMIFSDKYFKDLNTIKNELNFNRNRNMTDSLVDKKALVVFRVNKTTVKLEEIKLKYDSLDFYDLSTNVKTFDSIKEEVFDPLELKNEGVICEIVQNGDKKQINIAQFIIENILKWKNK